MKGIIETSVYLVIFALVCFFSIDFIRINQRVSDAGEISQYPLSAAMFGYSSQHTYNGLARYFVS